jgi:hypothetical protein
MKDGDSNARDGEGTGDDDRDDRSLEEIVNGDRETYYTRALDAGACYRYDEDEDAPTHAVAFVANGRGERGWFVISANGHSWEGLEYEVSYVFETRDEAVSYALGRVCDDEDAYTERMEREAEEEMAEEDDEAPDDEASREEADAGDGDE